MVVYQSTESFTPKAILKITTGSNSSKLSHEEYTNNDYKKIFDGATTNMAQGEHYSTKKRGSKSIM